jgi:hypothetical protein
MNEIRETSKSRNSREELNAKIFQIEVKRLNIDPETIRRTAITREFVPTYRQGDLCDRPERKARPTIIIIMAVLRILMVT